MTQEKPTYSCNGRRRHSNHRNYDCGPDIITCSCKCAKYCSRECKSFDYWRLHQYVCSPKINKRLAGGLKINRIMGIKPRECISLLNYDVFYTHDRNGHLYYHNVYYFPFDDNDYLAKYCASCGEQIEDLFNDKEYYMSCGEYNVFYALCSVCIKQKKNICPVSFLPSIECYKYALYNYMLTKQLVKELNHDTISKITCILIHLYKKCYANIGKCTE